MRPLLEGLRQRDLCGERVFAAIGRRTFSSGMSNAWQLQHELGAVLIGEPTSQEPDGFGELCSLRLPNTAWQLDGSTKRFRFFGGERPSLAPDALLEQRCAELLESREPVLEGREPVLEWVLRQSPAPR